MAETINGLYKAEVIWRQRSWRSASAVEMATLRWVDWPNNRRHFGPIGHFPPAEPEANCYLVMIGELLGHAIIGTSQRHAHLDDATLLEASDTIGLAINTWMREGSKVSSFAGLVRRNGG